MTKEDKIVNKVYEDTMYFLSNETNSWNSFNGSYVAYGLLCAVFNSLFKMTNKNNVIEVILMALTNHIDKSDFNNIMNHLSQFDQEV